jgi:hypothetical protein
VSRVPKQVPSFDEPAAALGRDKDDARRQQFEAMCQTQILTVNEFCDQIAALAAESP